MANSEKDHGVADNPMVQVSKLREPWVVDSEEFMGDEDFGHVLDLAARLIADDFPDRDKLARVMVRLEAYALKFRSQFSAYMSYKKGTTEANMKKNHYKEVYTGIDNLVDSLKWMLK